MHMQHMTLSRLPLAAVLIGALGLVACDRKPEQGTVGQQVDTAIAKAEQKTQAVIAKVEQKADAAATTISQKTDQAMDTASAKMKDPDGHFKFPHLWPPKLLQARRPNYRCLGWSGSGHLV